MGHSAAWLQHLRCLGDREGAVTALEEDQRRRRLRGVDVQDPDLPEHYQMIPGLHRPLMLAVDPCQRAVQEGSARGRRAPWHAGELVTAGNGEPAAEFLLARRQD